MGGVCCCLSQPVDFDSEVTLYHFDLHRAVGKGAFGKVCLVCLSKLKSTLIRYPSQVRVVEHKRTKKLYALKYLDKARCIKQKAIANIIQERRLLEEVCRHLPSSITIIYHSCRLTTHSLSIFGTHFRTMRIVSLSSISCLAETCDVR